MIGHFDITCAPGPDEETYVRQQNISAPWHLSKPYWNGTSLMVQAVNATAGIFAGDKLQLRTIIESDASVLMTSPSASRIHTMPHGEATLEQDIHVASGGWLEWMPELFIPQQKAKYSQTTSIGIECGGGLYFVESIAPGRVAHGESFLYDRIRWRTQVRLGSHLILAENYDLDPATDSIRDLKRNNASDYFASALIVMPAPIAWKDRQQSIHALGSESLRIGATQLAESAYLTRIIAQDSITLKESLANLRSLLSDDLAILRTNARKL